MSEEEFAESTVLVGDAVGDMDIAVNDWNTAWGVYCVRDRKLGIAEARQAVRERGIDGNRVIVTRTLAGIPERIQRQR